MKKYCLQLYTKIGKKIEKRKKFLGIKLSNVPSKKSRIELPGGSMVYVHDVVSVANADYRLIRVLDPVDWRGEQSDSKWGSWCDSREEALAAIEQ